MPRARIPTPASEGEPRRPPTPNKSPRTSTSATATATEQTRLLRSSSRSTPRQVSGGTTDSLVALSDYVTNNLRRNNIHLQDLADPRPRRVADLCEAMRAPHPRPLSGAQSALARRCVARLLRGCDELHVLELLQWEVSGYELPCAFRERTGLWCSLNTLFWKEHVPGASPSSSSSGSGSGGGCCGEGQGQGQGRPPPRPRVSVPKPDAAFGYESVEGFARFSAAQVRAGEAMVEPPMGQLSELGPYFPFLVVEAKSAKGRIDVATRQCLGGTASCVEAVDRLNGLLAGAGDDDDDDDDGGGEGEAGRAEAVVSDAVFSVTMNNRMAELYVSWKEEGEPARYVTALVFAACLAMESQMAEYRNYLRNIADWGAGQRFKDIAIALDIIGGSAMPASLAEVRGRHKRAREEAEEVDGEEVVVEEEEEVVEETREQRVAEKNGQGDDGESGRSPVKRGRRPRKRTRGPPKAKKRAR